MKISKEKPAELAKGTEKELFALFQGVDSKYKNKYRSLMFNLRDTKNNVRVFFSHPHTGSCVATTIHNLQMKKKSFGGLKLTEMHNLFQVLFKRVLKGEISPRGLVRMSAEELASKELAAWRQRENRHVIHT